MVLMNAKCFSAIDVMGCFGHGGSSRAFTISADGVAVQIRTHWPQLNFSNSFSET